MALADDVDFIGVRQARQDIPHFMLVLGRQNLVILKVCHVEGAAIYPTNTHALELTRSILTSDAFSRE
ncbi:MAG: hypothetical protein RIE87_09630 [Rhodospirillales bacterium]